MAELDSHQLVILKEYEIAQSSINAQNQTAWQTGSIFIVASFGVLAFVGQEILKSTLTASIESSLLLIGVALISWGTTYLWYRSYRRWGTFVEIAHRRMQEIEHELGMWKNRDTELVDTIIQKRAADSPVTSEKESTHYNTVTGWARQLDKRDRLTSTSIHISIRGIVALLLFGWLGIIVYYIPNTIFLFGKLPLVFVVVATPIVWFFIPQIRSWFRK